MKSDRALIFDLDGTLWDTVAVCARAWNQAIQSSGLAYRKMSEDDVRGGMGLAADELRAKVFPDLEPHQGMKLLKECFEQEIVELDKGGAKFFPGVLEGIQRLSLGHDLYVVSNCDGPYLDAFFRVSGLAHHFKDSECHGKTGLPKGENIRLILTRNSIRRAIYVGDTSGDQKAAGFAGVPFVFARYGFGDCARFDGVIDSFAELENELARSV